MGGLGRRLEDLHDGVRSQDLRSVEDELSPLGLIGSGLQQATQSARIECIDETRDPLTQLVLDAPLTPGHLLGHPRQIAEHYSVVRHFTLLAADGLGHDQWICRARRAGLVFTGECQAG